MLLTLEYCYSYGYDVDHNGFQWKCQKQGHNPNVKRDEAHIFPGACMVAQHKTLPDGTGMGKGCILSQSVTKAQYGMNKSWRNQSKRYLQQTKNNWRGRGHIGGVREHYQHQGQ